MSVNSLSDLFEHELEDIYFAEHALLDALEELANETEHEEIKSAFTEHREETQGHVERLEEVFEEFGEAPEKEECEGIEGLIAEAEEFSEEDPSQEIRDVFNIGAAEKTERYEITAYENLITLAEQLENEQVVELLSQNLQEEEKTLERLQTLSQEYDLAAIPAQ